MPRGAKRDAAKTEEERQLGFLLDRRSFISTTGHRFLRGVDVTEARKRAVQRATNSYRYMRCQAPLPLTGILCGRVIRDDVHPIAKNKAEMHHIENKPTKRCDCDHNLAMWCHECHARRHNQ